MLPQTRVESNTESWHTVAPVLSIPGMGAGRSASVCVCVCEVFMPRVERYHLQSIFHLFVMHLLYIHSFTSYRFSSFFFHFFDHFPFIKFANECTS